MSWTGFCTYRPNLTSACTSLCVCVSEREREREKDIVEKCDIKRIRDLLRGERKEKSRVRLRGVFERQEEGRKRKGLKDKEEKCVSEREREREKRG